MIYWASNRAAVLDFSTFVGRRANCCAILGAAAIPAAFCRANPTDWIQRNYAFRPSFGNLIGFGTATFDAEVLMALERCSLFVSHLLRVPRSGASLTLGAV